MSQHSRISRNGFADVKRESSRSIHDARRHSHLQGLLDERVRFETFLSHLSATFINLPADQIDGQIERGLQEIVQFLEIERSSLAQFSADGSQLIITHSYAAPGLPPFQHINIAGLLPWYTGKLRQGEILRFNRLPDDIPPEAVHERQWYMRGEIRSHLAFPFKVGDAVLGALGFGCFNREIHWRDDLVQSLQLMGEIFANALARKVAEESTVRLREQLALAGQAERQKGVEQADLRGRAEVLSPRERQVMDLVVRGLLNKQVGHQLGITEKTVKAHRGQVMRKMQAHSLAELVRMADRLAFAPIV